MTISKELAIKILNHLKKNNMGFCYLPDGQFITVELCEEIINQK